MSILIFIIILLVLIIGHELGHFLAAKWAKMKVLEFGVGFPPKAFGKTIGETEYTLNWLPFGGFVRIFGEDANDMQDPRAFSNRPALHQAIVLFAGPFANMLLAIVFSALAFMVGTVAVIDSPETVAHADNVRVLVGDVLPESPAARSGIEAGDEIRALVVNGGTVPIQTTEDVSRAIALAEGEVIVSVRNQEGERDVLVTPVAGLIIDEPERLAIGVATALVGDVSYPFHIALFKGVQDTINDFIFVVVSLGALIGGAFTLSADISSLAGPVGIASLTGDAAALGAGVLFSFAALLSVNLAVINLLPFPALDGGRLLFLGIEVVSRRKIPLMVAQYVNVAGFAALILLMIAITAQDISRLIG